MTCMRGRVELASFNKTLCDALDPWIRDEGADCVRGGGGWERDHKDLKQWVKLCMSVELVPCVWCQQLFLLKTFAAIQQRLRLCSVMRHTR